MKRRKTLHRIIKSSLPQIEICRKELEQMWKILEVCWKDNQIGLANIQNLDPSTTF